MPYSDGTFDDLSSLVVKQLTIHRCLDIGAGNGKYGKLVREFHPNAHIIGIEIEPDYITRFQLHGIYNEVWCMPAQDMIDSKIDDAYDFVMIGDTLEHLKKSDGIDLLNFLVYRTRYMLVIYPERYLQGSWEGYRSEAHISFWKDSDFHGLDYILARRRSAVAVGVNGYLTDSTKDTPIQKIFALAARFEGRIPLKAYPKAKAAVVE